MTTAQPGRTSSPPRPARRLLAWQTSSATPYKRSSAARDVRLARFDLRIIREKQPCVERVDTPECVANQSRR